MPQYKLAQQARERAKRIREVRASVLDRLSRREADNTIRRALQSTSASEFVSTEVL
jgi:hypothetical protein